MPKRLYEQMERLANQAYPLETGGVLIGYAGGASDNELVITAITGPGPNAIQRLTSFEPDHDFQVGEIAYHYRKSRGIHTYLGDWHTHPDSGPELSRLDKKTLKRIALHREARLERPVMAILANGSPWILRAWRFVPASVLRLRSCRFLGMEIRKG